MKILYLCLFLAIANFATVKSNAGCENEARHDDPYNCGSSRPFAGLNEEQKNLILDFHNNKRRYVASGNETRGRNGPQPSALEMPNLEWDDELASLAQGVANHCLKWHSYVCVHSNRFDVGQSLSHSSNAGYKWVGYLLDEWYNEVDKFDAKNVKNYKYDQGTRRYAQIVSARTTKIGCGLTQASWNVKAGYKKTKLQAHTRLVCNYGPDGLKEGEPLYETECKGYPGPEPNSWQTKCPPLVSHH